MKCNLIAMRFYFGFQKRFFIDRIAFKYFFDVTTDFSPNSILYFCNKLPSSIK